MLSFHRLLKAPIGESAAHSDENIGRFCLKSRVRPKQPIHANRPLEASRTRTKYATALKRIGMERGQSIVLMRNNISLLIHGGEHARIPINVADYLLQKCQKLRHPTLADPESTSFGSLEQEGAKMANGLTSMRVKQSGRGQLISRPSWL